MKETYERKLKCRHCERVVHNVGEKAISVLCDECTQKELNNALKNQEKSEMKGGITMTDETEKKIKRKDRYLAMEPKIIELSKAGKKPSEIKKELGEGAPGLPKIARIIAKGTK